MSAYLEQLADAIRDAVPEHLLPAEGDSRELFLIYAVLALAKGETVQPADVHDAWVAWMLARGEADHDSMVPFDQLPEDVQREDEPFVAAIRSVARDLPPGGRR